MDHVLGAYVPELMHLLQFGTLITLFPDVELKVKKPLYVI